VNRPVTPGLRGHGPRRPGERGGVARRPGAPGPDPGGPRPWRDDRGALTLSYVAVLPFILVFIMVLIQASFWFLARNAALAAARQGTDAARVLNASRVAGPAAALAFARQAGQGYLEDPRATATGSTSVTISITVSGHVPSFVPGLVVSVSETAQAPAEEFRP
jgi:Flp pilus assembly protein TadG